MRGRLAAVVVGSLLLTGCGSSSGGGGLTAPSTTRLEEANTACSEKGETSTKIEVVDDGAALVLSGIGDGLGDTDAELAAVICLWDELGTTQALRTEVSTTTALSGTLEEVEDNLEYKWSYHPDNGVNMTIAEE